MVVGNDIVDLDLVRQNPKANNPKFLRKVLTDSEYQTVTQSKDTELSLWIHWALKESAYKADFQIHQQRYFAPKKLVCQIITKKNEQYLAKIITPFNEYRGQVTITKDYIHAVAIPNIAVFDHFTYQIISCPTATNLSLSVRKNLCNYLQETYQISESVILIDKKNDIPQLKIQNKQYALSLSHHGKWGAWTIKKPSATKQMTQIF